MRGLWRGLHSCRPALQADMVSVNSVRSQQQLPAVGGGEAGGVSTMLNQYDQMSVIQAHDKYGFKVNGIHMRGSVLVFPNFTLLWNCTRVVDICPRNVAVVHMVRPKIDILFIGTGDRSENINPSLYAYFQRHGVSVEPMNNVSGRRRRDVWLG